MHIKKEVIMSNDNVNVYERLYKLQGNIAKQVLDGKRSPEYVASCFQRIMEGLPCGPVRSSIFHFMEIPLKPEGFGDGTTVWKGTLSGDGLTGEDLCDGRLRLLREIDLDKVDLIPTPSDYTGFGKFQNLMASSSRLQLGGTAALSFFYDMLLARRDSHIVLLRNRYHFRELEFFGLILRDFAGRPCVISFKIEGEHPRMYLNPLEEKRSPDQYSIELKCSDTSSEFNPS
jgi:hypothetical protein